MDRFFKNIFFMLNRNSVTLYFLYSFSLFFIFTDCKLAEYHNSCDTRSPFFWNTLLLKVGLGDHSSHCGVSAFPILSPVEPLYVGRSRWLDYVKNDGKDFYSASNTPCDGSETGGYSACIHVGEMRSVRILFGSLTPTSCEGFTASDSENAFQYGCTLLPTGGVRLSSTSLKSGKLLGDLIDKDSLTFKPIQIFVFHYGKLIGETEKSIWWTNPIKRLLVTGGVFNTPYEIHYSGSDSNVSKIIINASNVAIAQSSNSLITVSGANSNLYVANGNFPYIEGKIESNTTTATIHISASSKFAYLRQISILGTQSIMIWSVGSFGFYKNLRLFGNNSSSEAIKIGDSGLLTEGLVYESIVAGNVDGYSISLYGLAAGSQFRNIGFADVLVYSGSSAEAILIGNTGSSIVEGILIRELTMVNSAIGGLIHQTASSQPMIHMTDMNLSFVNNGDPAFNLFAGSNQDLDLKVLNLSSLMGNVIVSSVNNSYFTGNFKISAGSSCTVTGGIGFGFLNSTCQKNGLSDFSLTNNLSSNASYFGPITADDKSNTFDNNGYHAGANPTSLRFYDMMDNPYRVWGIADSTDNLTIAMRGNCGGPCRIYDWTLRKNDTILRTANSCPDPTKPLTHTISGIGTSDAECSAIMRGSKNTVGNLCTITHLRNAVEILGDAIGNENLFCESNEDCVYTPNISAYQGHGNRVSAVTVSPNFCPDIGTGNGIENVKLYQYESNGY